MRLISRDYHETRRIDRSSSIRRRAPGGRASTVFCGFGFKKEIPVIFFFSSADSLAYDRVPEEFIYPVNRKILLGIAIFCAGCSINNCR
jgi:hypothetical protein